MERAERLAGGGQVAVGRVRGCAGTLGVEGDDGVEGGVGPGDVLEVLLQQGPAGDLASAQGRQLFAGGRQVQGPGRGLRRAGAGARGCGRGGHGRRGGDDRAGDEQGAAEDHERAPDVVLLDSEASRLSGVRRPGVRGPGAGGVK